MERSGLCLMTMRSFLGAVVAHQCLEGRGRARTEGALQVREFDQRDRRGRRAPDDVVRVDRQRAPKGLHRLAREEP